MDLLYVCDTSNHRVQVFDHEYEFKAHFSTFGMKRPKFLSVYKDEVFVADEISVSLFRIVNSNYEFVDSISCTFVNPSGLGCLSYGSLMVNYSKDNRIIVYVRDKGLYKKDKEIIHKKPSNFLCSSDYFFVIDDQDVVFYLLK